MLFLVRVNTCWRSAAVSLEAFKSLLPRSSFSQKPVLSIPEVVGASSKLCSVVSSSTMRPPFPPATFGDRVGEAEGSCSLTPTAMDLISAFRLSCLARFKACWSSRNSSSSRTRSCGMDSDEVRLIPVHRSAKLSGTGSFCRGLSLRTVRSFWRPDSVALSPWDLGA